VRQQHPTIGGDRKGRTLPGGGISGRIPGPRGGTAMA
jgi:hypothetical protein